jgi:phage tail sheath protein FI
MTTYKTPGVYVEEISVFPPSVAEVETAIPAFIGYTGIARKKADNDLILKPTKIYSLKDYEQYFGLPSDEDIDLTVADDGTGGFVVSSFTEPSLKYLLYYSVQMYFANGGGQCYIVSVGTYQSPSAIDMNSLQDGLDVVKLEDEPTLIVIPEAVELTTAEYQTLVGEVLLQCNTLGDRFAIFDIFDGQSDLDATALATNRGYFGTSYLKYGAAYYPFLKSTMNFFVKSDETNVNVTYGPGSAAALASIKTSNTAVYNFVKTALKEHFVVLPPSGAVSGVYAATDSNRGVWKAPANVSLNNVVEPVIKIDNEKQNDMNVDATTGISINAIRAFMGKGCLVWGARTLAGNDNEWRYVNVRRFFNMVEESVKKSTYWAVFEPNDANTWVKVRGMIENYLVQKWREGALAGATPKEAFFVRCGLGTTMTAQDILEGRMNVEIGMAVVRPAEFIILKFSHKLQTS